MCFHGLCEKKWRVIRTCIPLVQSYLPHVASPYPATRALSYACRFFRGQHQMSICNTTSALLCRNSIRSSHSPVRRIYSRSLTMSSAKFPPEELKQIVEEVASLLKERGETISVAETV